MVVKYLWIRGRRYYLWKSFNTWREAYEEARAYCRSNKKNRYFIQIGEEGALFPQIKYRLYMTHVFKLW